MPRKVKELSNIEIDEISLVDRPANQHARVAIAKRAPEEDTVPEIYNESGDALDPTAVEPGDIVYDSEGNAYEAVLEDDEQLEFEVDDREPELVGKNFADEVREDLSKALSNIERDEVISKAMARVSELEKRAEQAEAIAKSERDLRLTAEYVEVAKNYNVPVDPTVLGPVLMRMAESMSYEDCEVIHKALTSSGAALFDEIGYIGGGDNADVMSQVEAALDEAVSKSEEGISKAAAVESFFLNNPAAYDEYVAEKRR